MTLKSAPIRRSLLQDTKLGASNTTSYTYDSLARVSAVNDPLMTGAYVYGWDAAGRLSSRTTSGLTSGNALAWTRTYEAGTGRVKSQTIKAANTTLVSSSLAYDKASNVTARTQSVGGTADSWTYLYDGASRMTSATGPDGAHTYGWDGASNRISVKDGTGPVRTTTFDSSNLPTRGDNGTPTNAADDLIYAADPSGNLTSIAHLSGSGPDAGPDLSLTYDPWGRIQGSGSTTYGIDPYARVVSKTTGASVVTIDYRGTSEDPVKLTEASSSTTYGYGLDGATVTSSGSTVSQLLKDLHGDVVGTSAASGAIASTRLYDPWGKVRVPTGAPPASPSFTLGFQGDMTDASSSLVDMGTRSYVPSMGRFSSQDALFGNLTAPNTMNQWAYGGASPVTYTDPTGMYMVGGGGCPCSDSDSSDSSGDSGGGGGVGGGGNQGGSGGSGGGSSSNSTQQPRPEPPPPAAPPVNFAAYKNILTDIRQMNSRNAGRCQSCGGGQARGPGQHFSDDRDATITFILGSLIIDQSYGNLVRRDYHWIATFSLAGYEKSLADGPAFFGGAAKSVPFGLVAKVTDANGHVAAMTPTNSCYQQADCQSAMRERWETADDGHQTQWFDFAYEGELAPVRITVTIGGYGNFDSGGFGFPANPFNTYTVDVP